MTIMTLNKKRLAIWSLMLAMFFNPLGYDVAFKMVLDIIDSYWITVSIFYLVAALFFGLYFYLSEFNPITAIKNKLKKL